MSNKQYINCLRNEVKRKEQELAAERFKESKKHVKADVVNTIREALGDSPASGPIAKAAWVIAISHPRYEQYINGKEIGSEKSLSVLQEVGTMAVRIAARVLEIRRAYYADELDNLRSAILKEPEKKVNNPCEMLCEDAEDESYQWHKKICYCNPILKSLLFFLLGLVTSYLFRLS